MLCGCQTIIGNDSIAEPSNVCPLLTPALAKASTHSTYFADENTICPLSLGTIIIGRYIEWINQLLQEENSSHVSEIIILSFDFYALQEKWSNIIELTWYQCLTTLYASMMSHYVKWHSNLYTLWFIYIYGIDNDKIASRQARYMSCGAFKKTQMRSLTPRTMRNSILD